jgi:hypothetical protein
MPWGRDLAGIQGERGFGDDHRVAVLQPEIPRAQGSHNLSKRVELTGIGWLRK